MEVDYYTNKRATAQVQAEHDLKRPLEDLLADIHDESTAKQVERSDEITLARTAARFASLLVALSRKNDELVSTTLRLHKILLVLTIALLLVSGALVGIEVLRYLGVHP